MIGFYLGMTVLEWLQTIDAVRRTRRLVQVLLVGEADSRGRKGRESTAYPQADFLRACFDAASSVDAGLIAQQTKDGKKI